MKKELNDNSSMLNTSRSMLLFLQPDYQAVFYQVPLSVAIRKDYRPVQHRKPCEKPLQYATDEELKRTRQQQHYAQLKTGTKQQ